MYFLLTILVVSAVIWLVCKMLQATPSVSDKGSEAETEEPGMQSALIVNITGLEPKPSAAEKKAMLHQESLDCVYARSHGLWVCCHCETLNHDAEPNCAACGAVRR